MDEKRRAAIYARFSTDLQSERSIGDQFALCRDFAAKGGYVVVGEYSDKARSGASVFGRDGLLSLMDDARAGKFQTIIIEALDRLSRDQEDLAGLHKRLSFAGVEIVAVHDGRADAIQIGIRGLVSTLFLTDLKHKIRRGMHGVVRDGRIAGGKAYGYKPIPGQPGVMEVCEDEAAVVRRIFDEVIVGRLPREIAAGLNRDGIAPPRGTSWNASTISGSAQRGNGIIRNPIYAGRVVWNRVRMIRDPETGKRVSRINPAEEIKHAEAPHLAIVDKEMQEAALAVMEGRAKRHKGGEFTRRPKRLLSGILRCGHCGGGMSIHDREKSGAIRIRCTRSVESGVCGNGRRYRLDKIEAAVIGGLKSQLEHPDLVAEYVRVYREERRAEADKVTRERAGIERRIADITGNVERLISALGRGLLEVEEVERQCAPLYAERKRLRAQLADAAESPRVELHPHAVEQYRRTVENLAARLNHIDGWEDRELFDAFRALVHQVIVHDRADGGVDAEVIGRLSALIGEPVEMVGGRVVAEDRVERYPHISMGRFAA